MSDIHAHDTRPIEEVEQAFLEKLLATRLTLSTLLKALRDEHAPRTINAGSPNSFALCKTCADAIWPCPTIHAAMAAEGPTK